MKQEVVRECFGLKFIYKTLLSQIRCELLRLNMIPRPTSHDIINIQLISINRKVHQTDCA